MVWNRLEDFKCPKFYCRNSPLNMYTDRVTDKTMHECTHCGFKISDEKLHEINRKRYQ